MAAVEVNATYDRRKRQLGDEGEQWAVAAVIRSLLDLDRDGRLAAVDGLVTLLEQFEGAPVEQARAHGQRARTAGLDEDELVEEFIGLVHLSRHSDAFGCDLLGWLAPTPGTDPYAMCLEVKSSATNEFHLSTGEWALARRFHDDAHGHQYVVLVVRRGTRDNLPTSLDLLVDPVALVDNELLRQDVGTYRMTYRPDR